MARFCTAGQNPSTIGLLPLAPRVTRSDPGAVAPRIAALALFAVLALGACYHFAPRRAEAGAPKLYAERCSTCHGPRGRGDGLGGEALHPPPRDFANRAWQASISDAEIRETIHAGGAARGLSALMPAQPDLST